MVSNMDYAKKESDFVHVEGHPIRNVMQVPEKKKFWLFDNEYSLYVGYKYLYSTGNDLEYTRWFWMQEEIIKTLCIFNEKTVKNIKRLSSMQSPYEYLLAHVRENDPLYWKLEASGQLLPLEELLFRTRFHERLKYIISWVMFCSVL